MRPDADGAVDDDVAVPRVLGEALTDLPRRHEPGAGDRARFVFRRLADVEQQGSFRKSVRMDHLSNTLTTEVPNVVLYSRSAPKTLSAAIRPW